MTRDQVEADLRSFLGQAMLDEPNLRAELIIDSWSPASEIPAENPIVGILLDAAEEVLEMRPRLGIFPGATDATYFQNISGIPTVPAFGPGLLPRAHSPNESVAVSSVQQAARIYAIAAARYLVPT
jgi:acetylornithine deacetylase/succinyl-diaminopimelate desuccinylase-like protein